MNSKSELPKALRHDFRIKECAEWSDTYVCKTCGHETTYQSEDLMYADLANLIGGICPARIQLLEEAIRRQEAAPSITKSS